MCWGMQIQDNDIVSNLENPDGKRSLMDNQDKDGLLVHDVSHAKSDNALSAPNQVSDLFQNALYIVLLFLSTTYKEPLICLRMGWMV